MAEFHDSKIGGHSGFEKTTKRLKRSVYLKGWSSDLKKYIKECDICQSNKYDNTLPHGLMQPLPNPAASWLNISMDFIEGMPHSKGKSVVLVVVYILTKYSHFISLKHPYSASDVAANIR